MDRFCTSAPLTDSQRGVYFECIENPLSTKYNIPYALHLPASIDADRFCNAVEKVAALHPALRATFAVENGEPVMRIADAPIKVIRHRVENTKAAREAFVQPFDLEKGPVCRFEFIETPEGNEFLLDILHLVFDGTSLRLFLMQIADAYDGKELHSEQMTMADVYNREKAFAESPEHAEALDYFRRMLDGADCDVRIIPDKDAAKETGRYAKLVYTAGAGIEKSAVKAFVKSNEITENTLFLSAFAYTLASFAGAEESYFTIASSGRRSPQLADTVGMFVRMIPIHILKEDGLTVSEYLHKTQDTVFGALRSSAVPFAELAHEFGVNGAVSFAYQGELVSEVTVDGTSIIPESLPANECIGDMICMMHKMADGYRIEMQYRPDLYSEELMRSFCDALFTVAGSLMHSGKMSEISLASDRSRAFFDAFNATESQAPTPDSIFPIIENILAQQPEATAVVCGERRFTFGQIDQVTRNIAAYIRGKGIGRDEFVAVLVPRNEYMVLGAWGAMRAGAAFQPLDPTYPKERLEYMISDSRTRLLIADRTLLPLAGDFGGKVLFTDEIASLPDADIVDVKHRPTDALTMIYTSGTTGKPKGCVLENRNLAAFWRNHSSIMGFSPASRVASYASFGFDAGVMDAVTVPMSGAALYIIPDEIRLDLPAMERFFCDNSLTHAFMTTQLGRMFAQQTRCPSLEAFLVGGEKLVPFAPPSEFRFINGYGPCETMGYICHHIVNDNSAIQPIGKPSDDIKLYVTDTLGRLLPEGAAGELCISGCQVGRGYLGLPEKTAEAFVANPFDGEKAGYGRMYRTGDVVRLLPSGEIEYIGRRDSQVKVRGFRVELTEIEEIIRRFKGISDATVAAFDDPAGGKFIAAYVVGQDKIDINALNKFILGEKPAYMVPAVTMQIDAIPYTQNQKVNRRALPEPQRSAGEVEIVPPENDVQCRMYDIAREILGHESFGVTTNLFEAGMTSIGLLKFNAGLGNIFDKAVKISDLRELATIKAIEEFLSDGPAVKTWDIQKDYPLMQNQMGVFVESGMTEANIDYNIPLLMRISDKIDPEKLHDAVCAAINAHPYLKTVLTTGSDGDVRAVRKDDDEPKVEIIRRNALPAANDLVYPFSLLDGALYRVAVYVTDSGNYLFFDVHHIIADGFSVGILLRDIDSALHGADLKKEKYTGFEAALDEEEIRNSDKYAEAEKHFEALLQGSNTECLPGKCPECNVESSAHKSYDFNACSKDVMAFADAHGITLNAFFNSVFSYTLSEFIHSDNVTYCTVYNGRNDSRLGDSFAMLVKTLPVCTNIDPSVKTEDFMLEMQHQLVTSMASDAVSFAEISKKYGIKSDIFFNYQGDNFVFDSLGGEPAEVVSMDLEVSKAPLTFEVFLENGRFRLEVAWKRDFFCEELIDSFAAALETAAMGFTAVETLGQVELMSEGEMAHFDKMNATGTPFEAVTAQTFFEREAALHPDRIAVRTTGRSLTFAQLDEMSSRLANSLLAQGVRDNEIVGLILERSEYIPVAEIGVLKAGCAFLPMLPNYPKERIDFCIKDASCRFCITEENVRDLVEKGAPERPVVSASLSDLAYCIYTSGSTGTPKGVMIEQHNLSNFVQTGGLNRTIEKGSCILCIASISFDMSMAEIFDPLCHGKTVYIASEDEIHNLDKMLAAFNGGNVDMMIMTPSFAWSLLSLPEFETALGRLKAVVMGAEAFQPALLSKLKELNGDMLIQNGYGPTECTQACSAKDLEVGDNITIGGPFANTKFYVMNDRSQLLPRYAVGELIICGEGVGRGYVGLPEKNKACFIEVRGTRAYRSGDLVRINRDGEVEFGGRKDNQVKLRGFRVELDEIEAVMQEFPGITRAKVVLRGSGSDAFLAGYFTASENIDIESLTASLKSKLTYYMVPAAMMQLEKMPMTQGGKLDSKALPEIKPAKKARGEKRKPKKSLEERILDEVRAAAGIEDCYVDDNFFEAGLTSLSASKVVMRLKSTGLKIEYQDIFDHQTAEELAEYLESLGGSAANFTSTAVSESDEALVHKSLEAQDALKFNKLEYASQVERKPLGNVLITGATGFLGCHIFKEVLDIEDGHIYCLLRKGRYNDVTERLRGMLFYYFDNTFAEEFSSRVTVIEGDITDEGLQENLKNIQFDTLINCAACVKHFANDNSIEFVNVHGVENLIALCKQKHAKMIQISTTSIPGAHTEETYRRRINMTEDKLFYVDDMNNQYCQSKYKAELLMLSAIREGMAGKIIRVGNLMGRHSDGEFQVNTHTNAFLKALSGFVAIGKSPISHSTDIMSLSPVDCTARAVVLLAGTNDCFTAFNADNRWSFDEMKLLESVNRCGLKVVPVQDEEYYSDFYAMMGDESMNEKVSALLTNDRPDLHIVETDNRFTANVLYRLGFSWPFVDDSYLDKLIQALDSLGFFRL